MGPSDFLAHLDQCVSTSESCAQSLSSAISNLQPGISDLPRLSKVLRNQHHYLVLPQTTVQAHKSLLSQALSPQIDNLLAKAETSIDAQRAKIQRMEERLAILQSRPIQSDAPAEADSTDDKLGQINPKDLDMAQTKKIALLRGKRRRLEAERTRLGL